jgi:probable H4MPT-linked C1 transfer pathway protein
MSDAIFGWDIGGVNTKAARAEDGVVVATLSRPFEIQRHPGILVRLLAEIAAELGGPPIAHAVTMTAELSQLFRTKAAGVAFVLDAVATAFPDTAVHVYAVDGRFLALGEAALEPLAVAASNWAATARMVAREHPDCLLIDVGTTTADLIPIAAGQVVARGATDPARLFHGELVYSGAVRTPVEAIVRRVPLWGGEARVSAEGFALSGDVHLWRGALEPSAYAAPTPDGRPVTRRYAAERLARIVCADREMLDDEAITAIASAVAEAQVEMIADAARTQCGRHPSLASAVVTGLGDFLAAAAAQRAGLHVIPLAALLGEAAARSAPAAAVALLLERWLANTAATTLPGLALRAEPVR